MNCRFLAATAALFVGALPAFAWEPITHVALAQMALADALDDGKVSIYQVDYNTGQVIRKVGDYPVDPDLLAALRSNRAQYFAGCLGPDAFPDIMTGQEAIHPGDDPIFVNGVLSTVPGLHHGDQPGEGTDAWLTYMWNKSRGQSPAVRAWVAGFFTHCAGDLFAHTFINNYAGGKFTVGTNGVRHVTLEGYLGKRGPQPSFVSSLDGVGDFMYRNLVRMDPNSQLSTLLVGQGAITSIPYQFSTLRNSLQAIVDSYQRMSPTDQTLFNASHLGEIPYLQAWIQDIDSGLQAWPEFSYEIAQALFFNPEGMDTFKAKDLANKFYNHHLLSMMGFPDAVGILNGLQQDVIDALIPVDLQEEFLKFKADLIDFMFHAVGLPSPDDVKAYIKDPQTNFDLLMGPNSAHDPTAATITLKDLNQNILHISDPGYTDPSQQWTVDTFAPAYNTVTLTKILFMNRDTVNQLIRDLKALQVPLIRPPTTITPLPLPTTPPPTNPTIQVTIPTINLPTYAPLQTDNVMLGWHNSLDDDNQWHRNAGKLVFVDAGVYDMLFKKQIGENDKQPLATKIVTVNIQRVRAIDALDPFGNPADFYAKITIDGNSVREKTIDDQNDISPNWTFAVASSPDSSTDTQIPVHIEIYDEDGGLLGSDDHCHINPSGSKFDIDLKVDRNTGAITGDLAGNAGVQIHSAGAPNSGDRAELWFTVSMTK